MADRVVATAELRLSIKDLQNNVQKATEEIKEINRVFKAETKGMDNWTKNADGLAAKLKSLEKTLVENKKILESSTKIYNQQKEITDGYKKKVDETRKAITELVNDGIAPEDERLKDLYNTLAQQNKSLQESQKQQRQFEIALLEAKGSLEKTQVEIKKYKDAQTDLERQSESTAKKVKDQEKELRELKKEYADVAVSQGKESEEAVMLGIKIQNLSREIIKNKNALNETQKEADELDKSYIGMGNAAGEASKDIEKSGKSINATMQNFLGNLAATAVTKAWDALRNAIRNVANELKEIATSGMAYADEINTLSSTTGLAVDTLQEFRYAEDLLDVSTGTLANSMKKLKSSVNSANKGNATTIASFEKLGVSIYGANGQLRNSEEIFFDAIEALSGIQNETERDATAMELFGKSASDLNPLIEAGTAKLEELRKEAHETGAVLSGESLEALSKAQDAMDRLSKKADALKTNLAAKLAPSLETVFNGLNEAFNDPRVQKGIDNLAKSINKTIDSGMGLVKKVVPPVVKFFKQIATPVKNLIGSLKDIGKSVLPTIFSVVNKLADPIKKVLDLANKIVKAITPLIKTVLKAADQILSTIIKDISDFVDSWGPSLVGIIKIVSEALKFVLNVLSEIHKAVNFVIGPVKDVINFLGKKASVVLSGLTVGIEGITDKIDESAYAIEHVTQDWSILTDEYKENAQAALDAGKAYEEMDRELGKSYEDTEEEITHIQTLKDELDKLVDSKGRVNDEDLERAHFITDELEDLTGNEIEWNGNVISSYEDIASAIQEVIDKKRASKLIDIAEQKADQAKENLDQNSAAIYDKEREIEGYNKQEAETRAKIAETNAEIDKQTEKLYGLARERGRVTSMLNERGNDTSFINTEEWEKLSERESELIVNVREAKEELAKTKATYEDSLKTIEDVEKQREKATDELKTLRDREEEYYSDIERYEEAYLEFAQGNFPGVQELLEEDVKNRYKHLAETGEASEKELNAMKREARIRLEAYERYREAYLRGDKAYNEKGLKDAKKYADEMIEIYIKAGGEGSKELYKTSMLLGVDFSQGFIDGIKSLAQKLKNTVKDVGRTAAGELKNTLQISSPSKVTEEMGKFFDLGFAKGIRDNVSTVNNAVKALSDQNIATASGPKINGSTTQNFTQNIYAPATPSRLDLYRDAKNLLAMAGGLS